MLVFLFFFLDFLTIVFSPELIWFLVWGLTRRIESFPGGLFRKWSACWNIGNPIIFFFLLELAPKIFNFMMKYFYELKRVESIEHGLKLTNFFDQIDRIFGENGWENFHFHSWLLLRIETSRIDWAWSEIDDFFDQNTTIFSANGWENVSFSRVAIFFRMGQEWVSI